MNKPAHTPSLNPLVLKSRALDTFERETSQLVVRPENDTVSALANAYDTVRYATELEILVRELQAVGRTTAAYRSRFLVRQGGRLIPLPVDQIAYFFSKQKMTFAKTWDNRFHSIDYHLDELEKMIDPRLFYRANRQFIISPRAVERIRQQAYNRLNVELRPASEDEVFISRDKAVDFRTWMGE
ncbi:LytR/AlgR family response regulator transcription factor [Spirosoma fluminis]